eukprot:GFUD01067894.1.p1 GENE.GFUD01067894.1~~GFUD01067894.1.p1  ORF type:complete len:180 (+),score=40.91 GFUD01067894.1:3-542(+)
MMFVFPLLLLINAINATEDVGPVKVRMTATTNANDVLECSCSFTIVAVAFAAGPCNGLAVCGSCGFKSYVAPANKGDIFASKMVNFDRFKLTVEYDYPNKEATINTCTTNAAKTPEKPEKKPPTTGIFVGSYFVVKIGEWLLGILGDVMTNELTNTEAAKAAQKEAATAAAAAAVVAAG